MPRLVRIQKLEEKQLTVDVEVEDTHSYQLENGWVSHNTVSQLVDCASGIHARFAKTFIRRVRCDKKDPMTQMMKDMGFPCEDDVTKPDHQAVFSFPMRIPKGAYTADQIRAIDQLELWYLYQSHWCEHKPSMTVYMAEHEWPKVGGWVFERFDKISGIAFLPYSGHNYKQPPLEKTTEAEYVALLEQMPKDVDWSVLKNYEKDDATVNYKEVACAGGQCELG